MIMENESDSDNNSLELNYCECYNFMGDLIDNLITKEIGEEPNSETFNVLEQIEYRKKILDLLETKRDHVFNKIKENHGDEIKKMFGYVDDELVEDEIYDIIKDREIGAESFINVLYRQSCPHKIVRAYLTKDKYNGVVSWDHYNFLRNYQELITDFICPPKLLDEIVEISNIIRETDLVKKTNEPIKILCYCDLDDCKVVRVELFLGESCIYESHYKSTITQWIAANREHLTNDLNREKHSEYIQPSVIDDFESFCKAVSKCSFIDRFNGVRTAIKLGEIESCFLEDKDGDPCAVWVV